MTGHANGVGSELAGLVADQNLTAALRVLEEAIGGAEADYASAAARLAQLHINKGYCHQSLSLSRKALKVRAAAARGGPRGGPRRAAAACHVARRGACPAC
jgi:hypothetical protein